MTQGHQAVISYNLLVYRAHMISGVLGCAHAALLLERRIETTWVHHLNEFPETRKCMRKAVNHASFQRPKAMVLCSTHMVYRSGHAFPRGIRADMWGARGLMAFIQGHS